MVTFQPADYEGHPCHPFSAPGHSFTTFVTISPPYLSPFHHTIFVTITTIFVISPLYLSPSPPYLSYHHHICHHFTALYLSPSPPYLSYHHHICHITTIFVTISPPYHDADQVSNPGLLPERWNLPVLQHSWRANLPVSFYTQMEN